MVKAHDSGLIKHLRFAITRWPTTWTEEHRELAVRTLVVIGIANGVIVITIDKLDVLVRSDRTKDDTHSCDAKNTMR
jgi:hypothetical protein